MDPPTSYEPAVPAALRDRCAWAARGLSVLLLVLATGCTGGNSDLTEQIEQAARSAGADGRLLKLDVVADFDWDRLHVFPPYANTGRVTSGLGFEWKDGKARGPDHDGDQLLVFVENGRVVRHFKMGRCPLDLARAEELQSGVDRQQAVFELERAGNCWAASRMSQ